MNNLLPSLDDFIQYLKGVIEKENEIAENKGDGMDLEFTTKWKNFLSCMN